MIVSHDRFFLDEVVSDTLHISGVARRLTAAKGNYSTWAARRVQMKKEFARRKQLRAETREKLAEFAGHGFKYGECVRVCACVCVCVCAWLQIRCVCVCVCV